MGTSARRLDRDRLRRKLGDISRLKKRRFECSSPRRADIRSRTTPTQEDCRTYRVLLASYTTRQYVVPAPGRIESGEFGNSPLSSSFRPLSSLISLSTPPLAPLLFLFLAPRVPIRRFCANLLFVVHVCSSSTLRARFCVPSSSTAASSSYVCSSSTPRTRIESGEFENSLIFLCLPPLFHLSLFLAPRVSVRSFVSTSSSSSASRLWSPWRRHHRPGLRVVAPPVNSILKLDPVQ